MTITLDQRLLHGIRAGVPLGHVAAVLGMSDDEAAIRLRTLCGPETTGSTSTPPLPISVGSRMVLRTPGQDGGNGPRGVSRGAYPEAQRPLSGPLRGCTGLSQNAKIVEDGASNPGSDPGSDPAHSATHARTGQVECEADGARAEFFRAAADELAIAAAADLAEGSMMLVVDDGGAKIRTHICTTDAEALASHLRRVAGSLDERASTPFEQSLAIFRQDAEGVYAAAVAEADRVTGLVLLALIDNDDGKAFDVESLVRSRARPEELADALEIVAAGVREDGFIENEVVH